MTNYNERLDALLTRAFNRHHRMLCGPVDGDLLTGEKDPRDTVQDEAKQALTSLIKELVAEARIDELTLLADFQMGDITVMGRNERSWRDRISELEQNLLKALETLE